MNHHDPTEKDLKICMVIKTMRLNAGMSQTELAKRIATTQSAVSDLEHGTMPGIPMVRRICDALGYNFTIKIEMKEDRIKEITEEFEI
jgi:transcriptional regulator with XRE-family HTH domain